MTKEAFIQVGPDNPAGKKVRNLEATIIQADGTLAVVELQVVSLADPDGNLLNPGEMVSLLREILETNKLMLRELKGGL